MPKGMSDLITLFRHSTTKRCMLILPYYDVIYIVGLSYASLQTCIFSRKVPAAKHLFSFQIIFAGAFSNCDFVCHKYNNANLYYQFKTFLLNFEDDRKVTREISTSICKSSTLDTSLFSSFHFILFVQYLFCLRNEDNISDGTQIYHLHQKLTNLTIYDVFQQCFF